ncbi:glycosyltransferase family 2 protein [Wenyingzhuangia marina]|uniref:Glycosyltransferase involved in cell wall bisynthesis n=1 Tax=Wenyingzhuangia marina TaxID=1195760 RepID=A0A1M5X1E7_9FLAO|nr:glycosyltransferase family 2 protein [Wenyingzhuangia marina]GGF60896.1 glycosyl transferase [Wenyingzhuangia marina]SHH93550.1 Glycosyltransferase involved in cell wall bisynthesis [Wenyingzhuangia marina]
MKITIITVCYNSAKTLETTIQSVIDQTYDDIEYIVVDGGSKDQTLDIIKKHQKRISKWISEPDNGLYDAMNKGVSMSTGDVVGLINSDDLFCDNRAIEKVMNIFKKNIDIDSVYADLFYVSQNNIDNIVRRWITGDKRKFRKGWHPAHPTFYVKKKIYNKYGNFNLSYKIAADFEIMLRFIEKYKISTQYLNEPLVKMRLGGETNKNLKNIFNQNIECIKAFKQNNIKVNSFLYPFIRILPKLFQFKK